MSIESEMCRQLDKFLINDFDRNSSRCWKVSRQLQPILLVGRKAEFFGISGDGFNSIINPSEGLIALIGFRKPKYI